ncbi:hypothetical protein K438DRAFT_1750269 [Mycena galopus ATCC 62051]|nr:hypothetical protein K438DRAFT_1750269 [Mycena galopus ATCC 62051]
MVAVAARKASILSLTDYVVPHNHIMPPYLGAKGRQLYKTTECNLTLAGYDLKQLFIGADGTLGIITPHAAAMPHRQTPAVKDPLRIRVFIGWTAYNLVVKHGQGHALDEDDVEGATQFLHCLCSGSNPSTMSYIGGTCEARGHKGGCSDGKLMGVDGNRG